MSVAANNHRQNIKCLVWDLDDTLWDGILAEGDNLVLKPAAVNAIRSLDQRGILHSIASKNNFDAAFSKLKEFNLEKYFLYPQIGWGAKSKAIASIAASINIGIDTIGFIDDQIYEREEVSHVHPMVTCYDAEEVDRLLDKPELIPRFITDDSQKRREMYQADLVRKEKEQAFDGPSEEFLKSLKMKLTLGRAKRDDLKRAEELTVRTNQLNTTGCTYTYEELDQFRLSSDHLLLIASLRDKYGEYGKIGLALIEQKSTVWKIKLLLMSCRVISRGVGSVLLNFIQKLAHDVGAQLQADFVSNNRNRAMYVTLKFSGFEEIANDNHRTILGVEPSSRFAFPDYLDVEVNL